MVAAAPDRRSRASYLILCGVILLMGAGYILYSLTWAFAWDEGFHILTAQLIKDGRLPYIDFFFPQTPLNAFWNAAWMLMCQRGSISWAVTKTSRIRFGMP